MAKKFVRSKRRGTAVGYPRRSRSAWPLAVALLGVALIGGLAWVKDAKEEALQPPVEAALPDEVRVYAVDDARMPMPLSEGREDARAEGKQEGDAPWYLALVNREHPIPGDYEPELVEAPGGERVDARIYEPLMELLEAAREGNWGELPFVVSGYRTAEKQQSLYDAKIEKFEREGCAPDEARRQAEQWVAVPGYSEHQLGFAVDINGATYDVYLWLQENSYKYGFIFRYPGDKTEITGVAEEVWHYRYVGVEAATEMYERGLCLEEYLDEKGAALQ